MKYAHHSDYRDGRKPQDRCLGGKRWNVFVAGGSEKTIERPTGRIDPFRVAVEKIHLSGALPRSTEKVRLLNPKKEGVWELKIHKGPGYRFYFFRDGLNRIVFTHGGKKPKDSRVESEVNRAISIKKDFLRETLEEEREMDD